MSKDDRNRDVARDNKNPAGKQISLNSAKEDEAKSKTGPEEQQQRKRLCPFLCRCWSPSQKDNKAVLLKESNTHDQMEETAEAWPRKPLSPKARKEDSAPFQKALHGRETSGTPHNGMEAMKESKTGGIQRNEEESKRSLLPPTSKPNDGTKEESERNTKSPGKPKDTKDQKALQKSPASSKPSSLRPKEGNKSREKQSATSLPSFEVNAVRRTEVPTPESKETKRSLSSQKSLRGVESSRKKSEGPANATDARKVPQSAGGKFLPESSTSKNIVEKLGENVKDIEKEKGGNTEQRDETITRDAQRKELGNESLRKQSTISAAQPDAEPPLHSERTSLTSNEAKRTIPPGKIGNTVESSEAKTKPPLKATESAKEPKGAGGNVAPKVPKSSNVVKEVSAKTRNKFDKETEGKEKHEDRITHQMNPVPVSQSTERRQTVDAGQGKQSTISMASSNAGAAQEEHFRESASPTSDLHQVLTEPNMLTPLAAVLYPEIVQLYRPDVQLSSSVSQMLRQDHRQTGYGVDSPTLSQLPAQADLPHGAGAALQSEVARSENHDYPASTLSTPRLYEELASALAAQFPEPKNRPGSISPKVFSPNRETLTIDVIRLRQELEAALAAALHLVSPQATSSPFFSASASPYAGPRFPSCRLSVVDRETYHTSQGTADLSTEQYQRERQQVPSTLPYALYPKRSGTSVPFGFGSAPGSPWRRQNPLPFTPDVHGRGASYTSAAPVRQPLSAASRKLHKSTSYSPPIAFVSCSGSPWPGQGHPSAMPAAGLQTGSSYPTPSTPFMSPTDTPELRPHRSSVARTNGPVRAPESQWGKKELKPARQPSRRPEATRSDFSPYWSPSAYDSPRCERDLSAALDSLKSPPASYPATPADTPQVAPSPKTTRDARTSTANLSRARGSRFPHRIVALPQGAVSEPYGYVTARPSQRLRAPPARISQARFPSNVQVSRESPANIPGWDVATAKQRQLPVSSMMSKHETCAGTLYYRFPQQGAASDLITVAARGPRVAANADKRPILLDVYTSTTSLYAPAVLPLSTTAASLGGVEGIVGDREDRPSATTTAVPVGRAPQQPGDITTEGLGPPKASQTGRQGAPAAQQSAPKQLDTVSYNPSQGFLYVPIGVINISAPQNSTMFVFHLARLAVRIYKGLLSLLQPRNIPAGELAFSNASLQFLDELYRCVEGDFSRVRTNLRGGVLPDGNKNELLEQSVSVILAHQVFHQLLNTKRIWGADFRFKGAEGLSSDQLFFIYFALDNCERGYVTGVQRLRESTAEARVNAALRQNEAFARAFRCEEGQSMTVKRRCPLVFS